MWQDLRHGARMLAKNPGFTLVVIASIAIGVGANAAMFSVADGLVLRPLPVSRPSEVVTVSDVTPGTGFRGRTLSYPDYADLRDQARSFDGLVAYQLVATSFVNRPDEPVQRKFGMAVSGNLFDVMDVRPVLGRSFRSDEDEVPGRDAVVILDHDEWAQRFGADPAIVNRRIRIGGVEFTVIGVTPDGFTGIDHDLQPAFYVPLSMFTAVQNGAPADVLTRRDLRGLTVKGRLRSDVALAQARQEVQQIAANLERSYPDTNRNHDLTVRTQLEAYYAGAPGGGDTSLVAMLVTLALAVLVVACANVAGLLVSRAPVRAREIALRLAIGAGRVRIVRQLVTESLLMAVGGGVLGLIAGSGVIAMFRQIEFPTDIPLKLTFELDGRVLLVGLVVASASAILSSLVPAWQATRVDLVSSIKDSRADASQRSRMWGRSALVCGQVALSLVLLTVSVFLYRTFQQEFGRGPGFRTDRLLMMTFDPGLARYNEQQTREFYRLLDERARAMPGVTSVTLTSVVPMRTAGIQFTSVAPEGFQFPSGTTSVNILSALIDNGYFDTFEIPIVQGRGFRSTDTSDAPPVVVVDRTFAAHYWPGQNAIGKRIRLEADGGTLAEIVGIASDAKHFFIVEPPVEFLYFPRVQRPLTQTTLVVATAGPAASMAGPLRQLVGSIDPNMPVFGVRTMEDYFASRVVTTTRLLVGSVSGMGSMGLALAMVGLYALAVYAVSRRTREIGIRMAIGAPPSAVLRMVLRQGVLLAMGGIALGLAACAGVSVLLRANFRATLLETQGIDLSTYVLVVPALIVVVMLAAYIPARRAARIDPLVALRQE